MGRRKAALIVESTEDELENPKDAVSSVCYKSKRHDLEARRSAGIALEFEEFPLDHVNQRCESEDCPESSSRYFQFDDFKPSNTVTFCFAMCQSYFRAARAGGTPEKDTRGSRLADGRFKEAAHSTWSLGMRKNEPCSVIGKRGRVYPAGNFRV
jgi:hypothetical protein